MTTANQIETTILVLAFVMIFRAVLGKIFQRKLRSLVGHQLLANAITSLLSVGVIIYTLYIWGVVQAIAEFLLAFSAITAVILFAVKDIWLENLFAGISMIRDELLDTGTEVEIGDKTGKIVEMTLTVTKVKTSNGAMMIVPNRMFRQQAFLIKKASPEGFDTHEKASRT
jgi:small-conductance mechanosensitive channel